MGKNMLKRLTLPVLAMLLIYYVTTDEATEAGKSLIKTIEDQNVQVEVNLDDYYTIYAPHESGNVVGTMIEKGEESDDVQAVYDIFTTKMNKLPQGVTSPLTPAAELIDYSIDQNVLTLNVTSDFLNYDLKDERKVLESLVYSFTSLPGIEVLKFKIDGLPVTNLNGTLSVERGLSKEMGINLELDSKTLDNTQVVTLFFLTDDHKDALLVPVTRLIPSTENAVQYVIQELINGPEDDKYISVFDNKVNLLTDPMIDNGVISLNFSNDLFYDNEKTVVSSLMLKQLVLTLTQFEEIKSVSIAVDGDEKVIEDQLKTVSQQLNPVIYK
ncbi:MAG TPA: hypothetical protein DCY20_07065 [Firmicutes bacterium]|nr:hypothetical protein [Bacillota bacterium]